MRHSVVVLAAILLSLAVTWSTADAQLPRPPAADVSSLHRVAFRAEERPVSLRKTPQKLEADQAVKIVCFGDSVTGVYYHTGGRRAYTAMVGVALSGAFPKAGVTAINAGISGNTTADGLKRMQKDVLAHKPDLVTVMFGLNDMVRAK